MAEWKYEADFGEALRAATKRPPISASRIKDVVRLARKSLSAYKHVVHALEKSLRRARVEHRLSLAYVMDAICNDSHRTEGSGRDKYCRRFANNLVATFTQLRDLEDAEKVRCLRESTCGRRAPSLTRILSSFAPPGQGSEDCQQVGRAGFVQLCYPPRGR